MMSMSDIICMENIKTLTSAEAAVELNVSERQIRRMAEAGKLERFRQGKKYLYKIKSDKSAEVGNSIILREKYLEDRARLREMERTRGQVHKSRFRWQVSAITAAITTGILAGLISIGFSVWQGRGLQLLQIEGQVRQLQETIKAERHWAAVERQRADLLGQQVKTERIRADQIQRRADTQQARADELAREIIQELKKPQNTGFAVDKPWQMLYRMNER